MKKKSPLIRRIKKKLSQLSQLPNQSRRRTGGRYTRRLRNPSALATWLVLFQRINPTVGADLIVNKETNMPAPDPSAVWFERQDSKISACYMRYFWTQNVGNRKARALAILKRIAQRDWHCLWCHNDLPDWRRADAKYCCGGCRKRAARLRRKRVNLST